MSFRGRKLRTEQKYYLHIHDCLTVKQKVTTLLELDPHSVNSEGYGVRSLYFDGPHAHALYDKNNGVFQRDKYRIRIYNGSDNLISVERKSKFGDYVSKEAARIDRVEYEDIMDGQFAFLANKDNRLLKEFYTALAHRAFRPATIVDYRREAYVYPFGNVRVTFDKQLSAGINSLDLFHDQLAFEEAIPEPRTIMEIKFDSFLPDYVRKIVQPHSHNRSSISKYVLCREVGIKHYKI